MKLSGIFTNNMVLQANKKVRVFGEGKGRLDIRFCDRKYEFEITQEKWSVELDAFACGGPYELFFNVNGEEKTLKNVYIGRVFLCAGQSNMHFTLEEENTELSKLDNEKVRVFVVDSIEKKPLGFADGWMQGDDEKRKDFSALAYRVADLVQKRDNVVVGVVCCSQGASNIQSWISPDYLTDETFVSPELRDMPGFEPPYSEWTGEGKIYNASLSRVIPYVFERVIWYQGESNTSEAEGRVYVKLLSQLVDCWRTEFRDDVPFIIVQICDYIHRNDENWRSIQTAQAIAPSVIEDIVTVASSDVCEHENIHPQSKRLLAQKIADVITS